MDTNRMRILALRVVNQVRADRRTMALIIVVPMILLSFLGILIRSDNATLTVGVVNHDAGATVPVGEVLLSDFLRGVLGNFSEFNVEDMTPEQARKALDNGNVDAVITVPEEFTQQVITNRRLVMDVEYEGSNPMLSERLEKIFERATLQAAVQATSSLSSGVLPGAGDNPAGGLPQFETAIESTYLHSGPEYDSLDYMAPALIGFFVFFFVFLLTSISFLRERVAGTLERLQATPIRAHEIIVGYMGGFLVFGLLQGVVTLLFTVFVLDIHYAGNLLNIFVVEVLLVALSVNVGIFLSTFAQSEFQVMQFIPLVVVTQGLLGGVIWQVEDMPDWIQPFAKIMPLTYANQALRDVMIKGDNLIDVGGYLLILLAFVIGVVFFSSRTAGRARI